MPTILFVFLDGVGLAPPGPNNPLSRFDGATGSTISGGHPWTLDLPRFTSDQLVIRRLDATLGIDGLPQSGTGQATLFTGRNCAERVGRHFGPFPHSATYDVLDHENVFHQIQSLYSQTAPAAFANAFPPPFFDAPGRRWTVTTRCCAYADVPLRDIEALEAGRALPADLTGQSWRDLLGLDVEIQSEREAATTLVATHRNHRLTLFEYFLTDKLGHGRLDQAPSDLLPSLRRFLAALVEELDPATETLLVTSDHGNVEDLSHTQHTRNPVPLFVRGWAAPYFADATSLTDVTPAVVNALRRAGG